MLLNLDYLKLHVHLGSVRNREIISFKRMKYSSRHFAVIDYIYIYDIHVAVMESQPHSSILHANSALIKIENQILYTSELYKYIELMLHCLSAELKGISRLDLACDFVKFQNNVLPKNLIKGFMREKYLRNGRGKYTIIGSQKNVQDVEYLRFGSKTSDVNVYLYNKTKEMSDVRHKRYIAERWTKLNNKNDLDVWRLEVSLTSQGMTYVDNESGEYFKIDINHIQSAEFLKKLYLSLVAKYFQFRINNNTKNKSRMPILPLFDNAVINYERLNIVLMNDITRRDKVFLKNLHQFDKRYSHVSDEVKSKVEKVKSEITKDSFLYKYMQRKRHEWDNEILQQ